MNVFIMGQTSSMSWVCMNLIMIGRECWVDGYIKGVNASMPFMIDKSLTMTLIIRMRDLNVSEFEQCHSTFKVASIALIGRVDMLRKFLEMLLLICNLIWHVIVAFCDPCQHLTKGM
ncbi:Phospholipid-transporting ATPase 1, partial [Mucuna pruriens]